MSKLRYDQIITLTDSDVDGAHIASLLATFFFRHMRPIIEEGKFYIASAPLYEVRENGKIRFFKNKLYYNKYIAEKIIEKYTIGRIIKKDDKSVLKKFTEEQIIDFIGNTENYDLELGNIASEKSIDKYIIEFILNNSKDIKLLPKKIEKAFNEIKCTKMKNGVIHLEGMYNENYQDCDLDDEFFDIIKDIKKFITENKYTNLYYKIKDGKPVRVFISELRNEILTYGRPKYRKRFKGLGEMDYDELWYTTMRPNSGGITQVKAKSMEELEKVFEIHFGNDPNKRKVFLRNFKISPDDIDN